MTFMTREQYAEVIDRYQSEQKDHLLQRFDVGAREYGALDLDSRDWLIERREEQLDSLAYKLFERERLRRKAMRREAAQEPPQEVAR